MLLAPLPSIGVPIGTIVENKMILFKACNKCKGDLHKVEDADGTYMDCFQCGNHVELPRSLERAPVRDTNVNESTAFAEPLYSSSDAQTTALIEDKNDL